MPKPLMLKFNPTACQKQTKNGQTFNQSKDDTEDADGHSCCTYGKGSLECCACFTMVYIILYHTGHAQMSMKWDDNSKSSICNTRWCFDDRICSKEQRDDVYDSLNIIIDGCLTNMVKDPMSTMMLQR